MAGLAGKDRVMAVPGREPDNGRREITIRPIAAVPRSERDAEHGVGGCGKEIGRYSNIRYMAGWDAPTRSCCKFKVSA